MSLVLKVCTSPFTSKRRTCCVPPRYFPCTTFPLLSSRVSAAATLTKNNATVIAAKRRFKLRMPPSLSTRFTGLGNPCASPTRNLLYLEFYCIGWSRSSEWLRECKELTRHEGPGLVRPDPTATGKRRELPERKSY